MAKIKLKFTGKPVKAGSTNKYHGGFPTQKLLKILASKKNG